MSNALEPQPKSMPSISEKEMEPVRKFFARALWHLERGDRNAAALDCKQTLLRMPEFAPAHSLAGLMALLNGDLKTARIAYGRAAGDLRIATPERERLIALRVLKADEAVFEVTDFITDLPAEIQHLRDSGEAAFEARIRPETAAPKPGAPAFPPLSFSAPTPAIVTPSRTEPPLDFRIALKRRRRISVAIIFVTAAVAALLSFVIVRALYWTPPPTTPPIILTSPPKKKTETVSPSAPAGEIQNAANSASAPEQNQTAPSESTSEASADSTPAAAPQSPPSEPVPALTPAPARTQPAPVSPPPAGPRIPPALSPTPRVEPAPAALEIPVLQSPAPATAPPSPLRPRETPPPRPAPAEEPIFPAMPRPRVTLPSASQPAPEFPRVIPDND